MEHVVKDLWESLEYDQAKLAETYCSFIDILPITDGEKFILTKLYNYHGEWYRRFIIPRM